MDITKLQRVIIDGLEDVKAQDIKVFNTTHLTSLFDRVIVASGTSNRQTKALANSVREFVKEAGGEIVSTEGEDVGEWVLVDCGDCVVHIMQPALRQYYNLEEIWGDKPVKVKLSTSSAFGGARVTADDDEDDGDEDAAPARKTGAKTAAVKKTAAKKTATGDASAKRAPAKKTASGAAPAKKVAAKKTAAKTAAPRKTAARKTPRSAG
ncbi:ribosome silencing factor [Pararobbsia silviterrae]|uniref:Ribosomal silencing factor RsfS n=1 Tax=Pararobbsia silviterrae TaxID=1792498 RepID=A0A494Y125_9BURK|nr:ribosome silencing factor [Pararobbsia silviterrae]RKP56485.1 ribosome silencing factor [Pararobbsia silviterrae]